METFKFLKDNNEDEYQYPTHEEFVSAVNVGREFYQNGMDIDENPYTGPLLRTAFEEGWELEQDYDIIRQAQQSANNDTI